ncbi:MAG: C-terminal helicase domain-containing protein, partial [Candidatus Thiodiazotropha taylori]
MRHKNLYPNLRDHTTVTLYDSINGVERSVCFIDHTEPEEQTGESTSYYNFHEAQFVTAFCKYLLQQGYKAEQITVLSPYMGQVLTLRKEMPKNDFSGIRITAVDN